MSWSIILPGNSPGFIFLSAPLCLNDGNSHSFAPKAVILIPLSRQEMFSNTQDQGIFSYNVFLFETVLSVCVLQCWTSSWWSSTDSCTSWTRRPWVGTPPFRRACSPISCSPTEHPMVWGKYCSRGCTVHLNALKRPWQITNSVDI